MSDLVRSSLVQRLGDHEVADAVVQSMKEGQTPLSIAVWLQDDLLEFTSENRSELAHAVQQLFIERTPLLERLDMARAGSSAIEASVSRFKRNTTAFNEMQKLYFLQLARIDALHGGEVADGTTSGKTSNDIEIARRLLMNMHEIQQDLGIDPNSASAQPGRGGLTDDMKRKLGRVFRRIVDEATEEPIDAEFIIVDEADDDADRAEGPESDVPAGDTPA